MEYLVVYLLIVNIIAFILYGIDKIKAKMNKWRISEKVLIGIAFAGGGVGAFAGMQCFRHKTKHLKFNICVPLAIIIWVAVIVYFLINN